MCNDGRVQSTAPKVSEDVVQALMLASRAFVGLATHGPQRGIDIAARLGVNPSTGTRMCDRLVGKGLIRRVRSTTDRRVVRLRLTPAGERLVRRVIERRRADLIELVAATADRWKPGVIRALHAFAEAAGEMPEQEWWLGWSPHAQEPQRPRDPRGS